MANRNNGISMRGAIRELVWIKQEIEARYPDWRGWYEEKMFRDVIAKMKKRVKFESEVK